MSDDEPDDEGPVAVTLLDIKTGRTAVTDKYFHASWWAVGNGSDDCNRQDYFGDGADDHVPADWPIDGCIGAHRFLIIAVDGPMAGYDLWEFNGSYPPSLIRRHLGDREADAMCWDHSSVWFDVPDYLDSPPVGGHA